ncbi:MAG: NYN domain-containing protein [Gemmatimonadota bacterium]|jgi:uncharacterized protein (TIGR00288 family)
MSSPYSRAPHAKGAFGTQAEALNAALLIDFDNVTMGMRSDLSKELSNLLNSDIIKGKVTVQRAYADWRRYPQYIVPLSENSVDLIFAPAYGSSKKNATDIRMAIDAIELVFIRPEIGTFILLTGDSDFSSLVLKLKEYGKYVIGVGIQESSSDILVQNCDEYYSYTSLTGLRKTTDSENKPVDPWVLVEQAVEKMSARDDVMRSDRLKQVMIEIDPTFDEGNFGFSKFSRFLSEAGSRDLVTLRKLDNGQYEVLPVGSRDKAGRPQAKGEESKKTGKDQGKGKAREPSGSSGKPRSKGKKEAREERPQGPDVRGDGAEGGEGKDGSHAKESGDPLKGAYEILKEALRALRAENGEESSVRDSDLKRKILELDSTFDERDLGFGKFSRFLRQAHDHEIVDLQKGEEGTYRVSQRAMDPGAEEGPADEPVSTPEEGPVQAESSSDRRHVGVRRGGTRGKKDDGPPALLEGQVVASKSPAPRTRRGKGRGRGEAETGARSAPPPGESFDPGDLGLPTDGPALIRYFTNSYRGVGRKTAESLVEEFGSEVFQIMHAEPQRLESVIRSDRVEQLMKGWKADLARRTSKADGQGMEKQDTPAVADSSPPKRRTRRGPRKRKRSGGSNGAGS